MNTNLETPAVTAHPIVKPIIVGKLKHNDS